MFVLSVFLKKLLCDLMRSSIVQFQNALKVQNLSAVFLTDPASVFYFSGFRGTGGDASVLITQNQAYILTDSRYTLQTLQQCPDCVLYGRSAQDVQALKTLLTEIQAERVGFENRTIGYALWAQLQAQIQSVTWIGLEQIPVSFRNVKTDAEIEKIQRACTLCVQALRETVPYIKPGVREYEVAAELEYRMRKLGLEGTSFETIVASGSRSALPHGLASDRIIQQGDAVTIDFGGIYQGYASDMTRTFFVGEPCEALVKVYNAVLLAQQTAIIQFKPGMMGRDLDRIARDILVEQGYGPYFVHSLGHGVGIEVHEGFSVGRKSQDILLPGMVFSIEPGVYIEGLGGVRIEDLVVATQQGLCVLTKDFEKNLAIL